MKKERVVALLEVISYSVMTGFVAASVVSIVAEQIFYTISLISLGIKMLLIRKWEFRRTELDIPFLIFCLSMLISTFLSIKPIEAIFIGLKKLLLIPLVYLTIISAQNNIKRIRKWVLILIGMTVLISLYGLWTYFFVGEERISATMSIYMTMGGVLMIVILLSLSLLLGSKNFKERVFYIFSIIIMTVCLLFTYTRSSWVGLGAGILALCAIRYRKFLIIFVVIILLLPALLPSSVRDRIVSIFDLRDPTNSERIMMWLAGLKIFIEHPIAGIGPIDMKEVYSKYRMPDSREIVGHFHNNFVQIGVSLGIIGLVSFIFLIFKILKEEIISYNIVRGKEAFLESLTLGCIVIFIGFIVNGFFEWNFGDSEIIMLIWFTVGLSLAGREIKNI